MVRVQNFFLSLDGFGTGEGQSLDRPFGHADGRLQSWFMRTATFHAMTGRPGGGRGLDDRLARDYANGIGAEIMGRNKFGPQRGPWTDDGWRGWWGDNPPYHTPVFVLTHHPRPPLAMQGGTTFSFVTEGIHAALERAFAAAGGRDVRLGGGVATVRQYLRAGLVDSLHLAVAPVLLGSGEAFFAGLDLRALGYRVSQSAASEKAAHFLLTRG